MLAFTTVIKYKYSISENRVSPKMTNENKGFHPTRSIITNGENVGSNQRFISVEFLHKEAHQKVGQLR